MANEETGPAAGVKGVVEEVKGKTKEVVGRLTGDEDTEREGQAQQEKADAERNVARREAQAEGSRREADLHEAEQKAHQG